MVMWDPRTYHSMRVNGRYLKKVPLRQIPLGSGIIQPSPVAINMALLSLRKDRFLLGTHTSLKDTYRILDPVSRPRNQARADNICFENPITLRMVSNRFLNGETPPSQHRDQVIH